MFCSNCGKELPDNIAFCTNCGVRLRNMNNTQTNAGVPWTKQYNPVPPAQTVQPELPMKWYKFMIYFMLFAAGATSLFMAIMNFSGGYLRILGLDLLYNRYEGLKTLDIGYGIVNLALIPFALYVRQALSKRKKDAPEMFYIYYIATELVSISYLIFLSVILDDGFSSVASQIIKTLAGTILYIALNVIYFNKRKHLFVN